MLGAKAPPGVESVNFAWGGVLKFNLCAGLAEGGVNLGSTRINFKDLLFLPNFELCIASISFGKLLTITLRIVVLF